MTPRQQQVFDYIKSFIEAKGFSPTANEIVASLGIKHRSQAHTIIDALINKGALVREYGKRRSLQVAA